MTTLRHAARTLLKTPALSLSAIGLLAAGMGGGTLLFSAFESVWLRPLPVRHPEELVRFVQKTPQLGTRSNFDSEFYRALKDHATSFASVFGSNEWLVAMTEPAPTEQIRVLTVTPEYFQTLGVQALHGRVPSPDALDEAVLSYSFWQRRFQGTVSAIGLPIVIHGHRFTI